MKQHRKQSQPVFRTIQSKNEANNQASAKQILQRYQDKVTQRQEVDEEELLQGKFETTQREEVDEEELLQGKIESNVTIQKQQMVNAEYQRLTHGWHGHTSMPKKKREKQEQKSKNEIRDRLLQNPVNAALPPAQLKINKTGLPDNLKAGIENLSGYSMDDVRVHYNSGKPTQLQALAYAQGTDIYIAPGQEKHLPHEAWHVVQQKQGRVQPTTQLQGVNVNDNEGLEKEADFMGDKSSKNYESVNNQYINNEEVYIAQLKVVQRVLIAGIEVDNSTNMPSWTQGGIDYHINLTTETFHVTSSQVGMPKIHYFFKGSGVDIEDKQPTRAERGRDVIVKGVGNVKTSTVFSKLPAGVQTFIKNNWVQIFDGR